MPNDEETRTADFARLAEILLTIEQELYRIVTNRSFLVPHSQEILFGVWEQIARLIERAIGLLRTRDVQWAPLENEGLTGAMLAMKYALFMQSVAAIRERVPFSNVLILGGSRRKRDALESFMKKTNTILGSLEKVLPFLGPVREYKEMVHASLR